MAESVKLERGMIWRALRLAALSGLLVSAGSAAATPQQKMVLLRDLVQVSVAANELRIEWTAPTQPPREVMTVRGPEAHWEVRGPAATRGVAPMTLELQRPPAGTRDPTFYWYIHIAASPQQLFIRAHRGGRSAVANSLRFQQDLDGTVHLVVLDNVNRSFVQARGHDMVDLRTHHPQIVRLYLVPLLRQLCGEDALLPGPTDVYRAFPEVSAEQEVLRQVEAVLPMLADRDYRRREAGSARLNELGGPAVCAVTGMSYEGLVPEQRARLDRFLARNSRRQVLEPQDLARDLPFLADCMEFDDVRIRRLARQRLERLLNVPIPMHHAPTELEWQQAADLVRTRIAERREEAP